MNGASVGASSPTASAVSSTAPSSTSSTSSMSSLSSASSSNSEPPRHRPHTRTQCQESSNNCPECHRPPPAPEPPASTVFSSTLFSSTAVLDDSSQSSDADSGLFVMPSGRGRSSPAIGVSTRYKKLHHSSSMASNMSSVSTAADKEKGPRAVHIVELPAEVLVKILGFLSFKNVSQCRLVSRRFNELCASMLNSTFQKMQSTTLQRFQTIKNQMPRRESARRNHPLARECDIVETLHMRLTLLQMTFGKHIERKHVCFFAGEILDEVQSINRYIYTTPSLGRAYKVTDELFDLSAMAMEYFKEHIEPTLPDITFFGGEFLDFTTPFTSPPNKQRTQSGASSSILADLDTPLSSSRDAFIGSSFSEPWCNAGGMSGVGGDDDKDDESTFSGTGSNMVLRKRIKKIRIGMKRYNDQLVEVKRELKSCKTKMESQTKQVQEYSQRLEDYDRKFEESTRKFQTLLTELNKCKTELQFWRSKSTPLSSPPSSIAGGSDSFLSPPPPVFCANCEDALLQASTPVVYEDTVSLADSGISNLNADVEAGSSVSAGSDAEAAKTHNEDAVPNTGVAEMQQQQPAKVSAPRPATRGSLSGPPSPAPIGATGLGGSRKRRANTDECGDASSPAPSRKSTRVNSEDSEVSSVGQRKSLRVAVGGGVGGHSTTTRAGAKKQAAAASAK